MTRFDVRRLENSPAPALELQADLLDGLNTRVVGPLLPASVFSSHISRLNPTFQVNDETNVLMIQHLSAVPVQDLGDVVCNLANQSDAITAALDFLYQGF